MAETHVSALEGGSFRYNGDSWELTGDLEVLANGETIAATARKTDRVRAKSARMQFRLQDPPPSLNPGNLGEFSAELQQRGDETYLQVGRDHATNEYRLENMTYE